MINRFPLFCLIGAAIAGTFAFQVAALPVWLARQGHTPAEVGIVMASYALGLLLGRLWSLTRHDDRTWRASILGGASAAIAANLGLALTDSFLAYVFLRIMLGIGFATVAVTCLAAIGSSDDLSRRGSAFGIYYACLGTVVVLAPPAGLWALQYANLYAIDLLGVVSALVAVAAALFLPEGKLSATNSPDVHIDRKRWALILAGAACAIPLGTLEPTLPFIAPAYGVTYLPPIYLGMAAAMFAGSAVGGILGDRVGHRMIILFGSTLAVAAQIGATINLPLVWAAILGGAGVGMATNGINVMVSLSVPLASQARIMSLFMIAHTVALGCGVLAGSLAITIYVGGAFLVSAFAMAIAFCLVWQSIAPQQILKSPTQ
jgi:MFS family permease